jgi:hypothetical protein
VFNRFDAIENNSKNNYLVNTQSTRFERDEIIPEPDYINPSDNAGGVIYVFDRWNALRMINVRKG